MPDSFFVAQSPIVTLPLDIAEETRAIAFEEAHGLTHLALLVGKPETIAAPLTRLHSSCITGDLLGSLRCDCGDQLHLAIQHMAEEGHGILLYLNQEGRGIGLVNKLRAYALQEKGMDTVEANEALGFKPDERDFQVAVEMLQQLHIAAIRLLTNNPAKMEALERAGIHISARVPLRIAPGKHNSRYLKTKETKLGHMMED